MAIMNTIPPLVHFDSQLRRTTVRVIGLHVQCRRDLAINIGYIHIESIKEALPRKETPAGPYFKQNPYLSTLNFPGVCFNLLQQWQPARLKPFTVMIMSPAMAGN